MRNILIILILMTLSACNSDKPKNDADINDKDSGITDVDIPVSDPDTVEVDTEQPDIDIDTDVDTTVPCLDLRYNENTIKTNFPFKDKNGKPTFCRPGCDTPTETDPQCVRNIWEWDNWEEYQVYLEAEKKDPNQYEERECYPWPCKMPDMKAEHAASYTSNCDRWLTVNEFKANGGAVWTHGMSDGVFGGDLEHTGRAIEYNPEKDEFEAIGHVKGHLNFNDGRYVLLASDSVPSDNPKYKAFVISVLRKEGKYYYELIYDSKNHQAFMPSPPFAGKDWVLIHICEGTDGVCEVKYAKAGEWEWHDLGLGKVEEGNIVGNHLTFMVPYADPDRQVYYCDLSKYPKSYKDCIKVTKTLESGEAEMGHSPRIDEDNENRLVYYIYNKPGNFLKEVIFKDGIESEVKEYQAGRFCQPGKVKGNIMIFTGVEAGATPIGCWYRFDKQKTYCYEKPWTENGTIEMQFSTFDGKWHLWKTTYHSQLRDMECYCKEEGVCPFEE
ncbi:MAG: hypothetical protein RBT87_10235 [bacterium]|nr:hypothetical protein [bacterium]